MNTRSVISGLMASAPAFAQRYDHNNDRNDQVQRGNDYSRHQGRNHRHDRHDRNDRYRGSSYGHSNQAYYGARHAG